MNDFICHCSRLIYTAFNSPVVKTNIAIFINTGGATSAQLIEG